MVGCILRTRRRFERFELYFHGVLHFIAVCRKTDGKSIIEVSTPNVSCLRCYDALIFTSEILFCYKYTAYPPPFSKTTQRYLRESTTGPTANRGWNHSPPVAASMVISIKLTRNEN